jgi:hypothetical protein
MLSLPVLQFQTRDLMPRYGPKYTQISRTPRDAVCQYHVIMPEILFGRVNLSVHATCKSLYHRRHVSDTVQMS